DADLAGLAVELGDAGVDLLAGGEALGPLLGAVAGEIGAADEGGQVGADDLHVEAAVLDVGDLAGDDGALAQFASRFRGERVALELLHAERDALLVDVDVEHHRLDHVAAVELLDDLLAGTVPVQIGQMHHAVDVAVETDEQAELGLVLDLALDLGAGGILLGELGPRIGQRLL